MSVDGGGGAGRHFRGSRAYDLEVGVVGKRGALIEGEEGGKEAWAV